MNMFTMDGRRLLKKASEILGPFLDSFFEHVALRRDQIDAVVPHQASGVGLKLLASRYGFREEQMVVNLPRRGNCIAASLPLAFSEAVQSGRIQRGHQVLCIGTGAGLSIAAAHLVF
jgi:3-oxoacyl-[acyl-carrier-protein] synthase-3